jgi:alcohol dehydrogenase YqhD (iron-dependent ADH family)
MIKEWLDVYIDTVQTEFESLRMQVFVWEKEKKSKTNIESAFLKSETVWKELVLEGILPQHGLNERQILRLSWKLI